MPVKRPFIKFDINSLKSIGETGKIASKNLFTEPKGFGNNPTLSTVIKFDCLLPEDLNLIPSLSVNNKLLFFSLNTTKIDFLELNNNFFIVFLQTSVQSTTRLCSG